MTKFILKNWLKFFSIGLILPLVFNVIFYLNTSHIFALVISLNIVFYLLIFYVIFYFKYYKNRNSLRSPFKYIKLFNTTNEKSYWDEFKKPLKHLTGIEIGVQLGNNAEKIINNLNIKKLYLVDPWKEYETLEQKTQDEYYEFVKKRFQYNSKVEILREESIAAAELFPDNFF
tara:strand:- start:191 stop:709 length:519 start_codon:yes stop_codon:yes gene_type:complete